MSNNTLKEQLLAALNIDDAVSLSAVKQIVDDCKPMLSKADGKVLDEAYEFQKANPLSKLILDKLFDTFTEAQLEVFLLVHNTVIDTMDDQSDKIGTILAKVAMDSETGKAFQKYLAEEIEEDTPTTLH